MLHEPFYNPLIPDEENYNTGPFGEFANGKVYKDEGEPQYNLLGHTLFLPFGIPAGPLPNARFMKAALDKGFDIVTHKTVRTRVKVTHPWPNILPVMVEGDLTVGKMDEPIRAGSQYSEPLSITNSFGNPSRSPDVWQQGIAESVAHAGPGQIVIGSFEGTKWDGYTTEQYIQDWVLAARLLKEAGAHAVEANFSCPNEGTTDLLCFDVDKVRLISEAIKNEIGNLPLLIKLAYFRDNNILEKLVRTVGSVIDGISAINTISVQVVNEQGTQALPGEGRQRAGVSGACITWAGLEMTRRLVALREQYDLKFAIIGIGGIMTPQDYQEYRKAGADACQSAAGSIWNPFLAQEIKQS